MNSCGEYFQSLLDYLSAPADPGTDHYLSASIAGNRQEDNPFVLYISVALMEYTPPTVVGTRLVPATLSGDGTEYFSDRIVPHAPYDLPAQPFDARQVERIIVSLTLPNGPL